MIVLLKKIPIPNLKHYCLFSISLLFIVFIYANKLIHDIRSKEVNNKDKQLINEISDQKSIFKNRSFLSIYELAYDEIMNEPWCVWVNYLNFYFIISYLIDKGFN